MSPGSSMKYGSFHVDVCPDEMKFVKFDSSSSSRIYLLEKYYHNNFMVNRNVEQKEKEMEKKT